LTRFIRHSALLEIGDMTSTGLIAVDLELTGLDSSNNRIVAMGWTLIDRGRIQIGSNRHLLINTDQSVGHSAAIHELTDSEVAQGVALDEGLEALIGDATGRVCVFHHAGLDVAFLQQACTAWAGVAPPFVVLDTMQIELALRKRRDLPVQQGDLQLGTLRSERHLPRYTAHNALTDAIATAELMLAIAAGLSPAAPLRLEPHVSYL
jgi:DNA polymerase-3 subunit epsilon